MAPGHVADRDGNLILVFRETDTGRLRVAAAAADGGWADWRVLWTSRRLFDCEPLLDHGRWADERVLSVYVQDKPSETGQPSALRVLSFTAPERWPLGIRS